MPNRARKQPKVEAVTGIEYAPKLAPVAPQKKRGPGRPKKVDLDDLIAEGQRLFLRGAGLEIEALEFIDRHRLHPTMLDCDAWWHAKSARVLFVATRPKSEIRFLTFAGLEDRAEHEMRISGLSVYRIVGKPLPAWGE